jgi:uncharacterized protein YndB with AHSA1/START domain
MTNTTAADRQITIKRLIDAPRELVFDAWTDPNHIGEWFGPEGFTTTIHEMEVRPGGVWLFIMHGPDGVDYNNRVTYREVIRPERLAYSQDSGTDDDPGAFEAVVEFNQRGNKTEVILTSTLRTAEAKRYAVEEIHAIEGGNQTLDRLTAYLAQIQK